MVDETKRRFLKPRRCEMRTILAIVLAILLPASVAAEISFFNDSSGNSGTIITPGGAEGGISFYNDSRGTSGTIITPGGTGGNSISFYNFSNPSGGMTSGTIQSFGSSDSKVVPIVPAVPKTDALFRGFGAPSGPGWGR
jgi:hypothetical protein